FHYGCYLAYLMQTRWILQDIEQLLVFLHIQLLLFNKEKKMFRFSFLKKEVQIILIMKNVQVKSLKLRFYIISYNNKTNNNHKLYRFKTKSFKRKYIEKSRY